MKEKDTSRGYGKHLFTDCPETLDATMISYYTIKGRK